MSKAMTLERATEFGSAWNSRDPDLVASFFADAGVYHASVGPDHLGKTYAGKEEIRKGVKAFFERFPNGRIGHDRSMRPACIPRRQGRAQECIPKVKRLTPNRLESRLPTRIRYSYTSA